MKIKSIIVFITACSLYTGLHAQIGKRILDRAKRETEYKVNRKIDEKVDKTIDKGVNEVDTLLTGKKKNTDKTKTEKETTPVAESPTSAPANKTTENKITTDTAQGYIPTANEYAQLMNTEWVSDIIFTNIKCDKGKRNVEKKLNSITGIKSAKVNIQNGELSIAYNPGLINYSEVVSIINKFYFEADGKPATESKDGCR